MRYINKILCSLSILFFLTACVPATQCIISRERGNRVANRLPDQMARSSVRVGALALQVTKAGMVIGEAHGSGIIFKIENERVWALTNNHVVASDPTDGYLVLGIAGMSLSKYSPAKVERTSNLIDAAVISFKIPEDVSQEQLREIRFARRDPRIGDTVFWMGHPGYTWNHFQRGMVSGKCGITFKCGRCSNRGCWATNLPAYPGNSGSQVVNKRGRLVGMISMNYSFSIARRDRALAGSIFIGVEALNEFMKDLLPRS